MGLNLLTPCFRPLWVKEYLLAFVKDPIYVLCASIEPKHRYCELASHRFLFNIINNPSEIETRDE